MGPRHLPHPLPLLLTSGGHHWRPVQMWYTQLKLVHLMTPPPVLTSSGGHWAGGTSTGCCLDTACKPSFGQGNACTCVCHSVHWGWGAGEVASQRAS